MNKPEHQTWPDGTKVRFTAEAKRFMEPREKGDFRFPKPLRTPVGGADSVYTADNTDDTLHDVILRENGERWGTAWLECAHDPEEETRCPLCGNGPEECYCASGREQS